MRLIFKGSYFPAVKVGDKTFFMKGGENDEKVNSGINPRNVYVVFGG